MNATEPGTIDRIAPTRRPDRAAIGYQSWKELSFLHWSCDPEVIHSMLPAGMTVDTFDGKAWVGLVPFLMRGIRPAWFPSVPGISNFLETNVRTYVIVNGEPGVLFFSLDASQSLAVRIARWKWKLPYFRSRMTFESPSVNERRYCCRRRWPEPTPAESCIELRIESGDVFHAEPGTIEHFLAERYLLFTVDHQQRILRGQVHHDAYPLQQAATTRLDDELVSVAGFDFDTAPELTHYVRGVDVEIFPLEPIAG